VRKIGQVMLFFVCWIAVFIASVVGTLTICILVYGTHEIENGDTEGILAIGGFAGLILASFFVMPICDRVSRRLPWFRSV
jgi:hypothetical protein